MSGSSPLHHAPEIAHSEGDVAQTDEVTIRFSDYRCLHHPDGAPLGGSSEPLAGASAQLSPEQSFFIKTTLGLCRCPQEANRNDKHSLIGWQYDTSGSMFSLDDIEKWQICQHCCKRQFGVMSSKNTLCQKPKPYKRRPIRSPDTRHVTFKHHSDLDQYMDQYRECCSTGRRQAALSQMNLGLHDPYMTKIRSHSDVITRLKEMYLQRALDSGRACSYNIENSPPSDLHAQNTTTKVPNLQHRVANLNLTPVPPREAHSPGTSDGLGDSRYTQDVSTDVTEVNICDSENTYATEGASLSGEEDIQHTKRTTVINHLQIPKCNVLTKGKTFTSSKQYMELTTPKASFPLPVHVIMSEPTNIKPSSPGSMRPSRCRSAGTSSMSQRTRLLTRGSTYIESVKSKIPVNNTQAVYCDRVSLINNSTNQSPGVSTGRLLVDCVSKQSH